MQFTDIDWNRLWQESRRKSSKKKGKADWDRRAAAFAERNIGSPYAERFIEQMDVRPEWSVLDVGAGPGTLSLPLAGRVRSVTAVDFSGQMLDILAKKADAAKLGNVRTVLAAWEDDWERAGIGVHDVAVASRSLAVENLRSALEKLDAHAKEAVFIGDRVGSGPFDPEVFRAVGREFSPGPDYIYTLNLLYQMGIRANVRFISVGRNRLFANREEAAASLSWMLEPLTSDEEQRFAAFMDARLHPQTDGTVCLAGRPETSWAVIWWRKNQAGDSSAPAADGRQGVKEWPVSSTMS